jgi:methionyl-tRNA formyltransferase
LRIVFAGTPAFAADHLEALIESAHEIIAVITQPDKPGKRGKKPLPSPVKIVAEKAGIPVLQPNRLKLADIESLEFDLMIVVAFGQILKPAVLAFPRFGCINVHASLLPRWRGAAPVQRALLAGDTQTGVTLIQMDAGLDTGDMLAKASIAIGNTDTTGDLLRSMAQVGPELLISTMDQLESGRLTAEPQDDTLTCYAPKLEKHEALIEWHHDAIQIDRQVRAFHPDPVAFTYLGDKRIKIHEGSVIETEAHQNPGEVLKVDKDGILIACASSAFNITRVQIPVGKGSILGARDVLNGWTDLLHPGAVFKDSPDGSLKVQP